MRRPRLLAAGAALIAGLGGFQLAILRAPVDLTDPSPLTNGAHVVGYELGSRGDGNASAFDLTLFLDRPVGPRANFEITLARPGSVLGADQVKAPPEPALLTSGATQARVVLIPKVPPGAWKLRLRDDRPFGLVHVTK